MSTLDSLTSPVVDGFLDYVALYGKPDVWTCPSCGVRFDVYPALPFDHVCSMQIRYSPKKVYYFMRGDAMKSFVEFCITGDYSPKQTVKSLLPDGTPVEWKRREEGDLVVFSGPSDWDPTKGLVWEFDKRFQFAVPLPDHLQQREALRGSITR